MARDEDGKAVGCGALKMHEDGVGEVKRMFTLPEVRGKRVGSVLVDAIVDQARARAFPALYSKRARAPVLQVHGGFMRIQVLRAAVWFWTIRIPNTAPF